MAAKAAPVSSSTVPVAVTRVCVVVALAAAAASLLLAVAAPPVSADPVAVLPVLIAARGSSGGGGRVGDSEPVEMDSEAHRRVLLAALRGDDPLPASIVLQSNKLWCKAPCTGKPGDPYVPDPRGCKKIYHCQGATSANEFAY